MFFQTIIASAIGMGIFHYVKRSLEKDECKEKETTTNRLLREVIDLLHKRNAESMSATKHVCEQILSLQAELSALKDCEDIDCINRSIENINENIKIMHDELAFNIKDQRNLIQEDLELVHETTRQRIITDVGKLLDASKPKRSPKTKKNNQSN